MTDDLARWVDGLAEGRRGTLVQEKRERHVWRVEERGRVAYAKRGTGSKRREIQREAENARALHAEGFGPDVLASGARGGAEWLVLAEAAPTDVGVDLTREDRRRAVLARVAAAVRRLHDAGFRFPDLNRSHVFLADDRVLFIDAARLSRRAGPVSPAGRAEGLAAFLFSLGWLSSMDRIEHVRFVADASGLRGDALRDLCRRVEARIRHHASRTRWRHEFEWCTAAYRGARMEAEHPGAGTPPPAWETVVRTLPDRTNLALGRGPDGRPLFFGKRFPPTTRGWSPAMREIEAIDRFQRAGVLVNRLAAYCEDLAEGSFVAVAACAGEPLDDFLSRGALRAERRSLALQTARIWRRMRDAGLRHRDAYACHLFVARTADPRRHELRLIDLTRGGVAPWPRERWFVKDAAQLWHGARPAGATRTDAVAWLRAYFRVPRLTREAKRFARRVSAKEAAIEARQRRKRGGA